MRNFLSILGALPSSTSGTGALDGLDVKKIVRLLLVCFAGAFFANLAMVNWDTVATFQDILPIIVAAARAGVMALSAALTETVRRILTNNQVIPSDPPIQE